MQRLGRRILNGLTFLSLLLFVATYVMLVRGVWYREGLRGGGQGYNWAITLGAGAVVIEFERDPIWQDTTLRQFSDSRESGGGPASELVEAGRRGMVLDHSWRLPGFKLVVLHTQQRFGPTIYNTYIEVSDVLIVLLTLILPASRILRRKRHRPGLCPKCGYDLRATPDRCPECGHVPAAAGKKAD